MPPVQVLKGYQRKYLRALAHSLRPLILIGQRGATPEVVSALAGAIDRHELVKVKFLENKSRPEKNRVLKILSDAVQAHVVGTIGHTAIFFRQNPDPEKQRILLPRRPSDPLRLS